MQLQWQEVESEIRLFSFVPCECIEKPNEVVSFFSIF